MESVVSHQYKRKLATRTEDLEKEEIKQLPDNLKAEQFTFSYVDPDNKLLVDKVNKFIERYEWLGKPSLYVTHRFIAEYNGLIGGVVTMDMPIAFSKLLGDNTRKIERLVSRGASASWTPKNLASRQIMWAIRWMVKNTNYRLFTAYADPEAGELGTIYQACNFMYLGQKYGTTTMLYDPTRPERGWFTDRSLRSPSSFARYAKDLGVDWKRNQELPSETRRIFNQHAKEVQARCQVKKQPAKHKYAYILGSTKSETRKLQKVFEEQNPKLSGLSYPKIRGL